MFKKTLLIMLLLVGALSYAGNALATVECCCDPLTCTFKPSALGKTFGVDEKDVPVNDCYYWKMISPGNATNALSALQRLQQKSRCMH